MTGPWRMREQARERYPLKAHTDSSDFSAIAARDEQGSGVVIAKEGFILTSNHVVESADVVVVQLNDGRKVQPVDMWTDAETDLALIRIETDTELVPATLGSSTDLEVGDWVVSLASPYDMPRSVSAGIVSKVDRWVPGTPHPLIQNDAATNPGSSGGALLNLRGEVVGVIIGGFSTRQEFQGIGLAVPITTAKHIADDLRTKGRVRRPYLGCQIDSLSPEVARLLALPVAGGFYVKEVELNSPAEHAGIQQGDILTQFDGQPIDESFRPEMLFLEPIPGETHSLTLWRDAKPVVVEVKVGERPSSRRAFVSRPATRSTDSSQYFDRALGLGLDELKQGEKAELGLPPDVCGVLVSHVASRSAGYIEGIAAGMVVLRINDQAICDIDDYKESIANRQRKASLLMLVQSDRGKYLVVIEE